MILKQTIVNVSDSSSINFIKVFQLYAGFNRKASGVGFYVKGSAKLLKTTSISNLATKVLFKKGAVVRALILRQVYRVSRVDSSVLRFKDNDVVLIKKNNIFFSKHVIGPGVFELQKKKILQSFKKTF
jgi:ribosomal protein L14